MSPRYHRTGQDRFRQPMPPHRRRHMHGEIRPMRPTPSRRSIRAAVVNLIVGLLMMFAGFAGLGVLFALAIR